MVTAIRWAIPGPRDAEALEQDANFRIVRSVRVGQSRVMRTRPIFHAWTVSVPFLVDLDMIDFVELADIAGRAGSYVGLGDHRGQGGPRRAGDLLRRACGQDRLGRSGRSG
jgi:hypothetical protein